MDDKAELVRLAFRVHALCDELAELERVIDEVVAPGLAKASAEARAIQAELREQAGMRRIDRTATRGFTAGRPAREPGAEDEDEEEQAGV